jgi:hypothetical protein
MTRTRTAGSNAAAAAGPTPMRKPGQGARRLARVRPVLRTFLAPQGLRAIVRAR